MKRRIFTLFSALILAAAWSLGGAEAVPDAQRLDELIESLEARDRSIERIEVTEDGTLVIHRRFRVTGSRIPRRYVQEIEPDELEELDYAFENVILSLPWPVSMYTRDELLKHGETDVAEALARRDPRIRVER